MIPLTVVTGIDNLLSIIHYFFLGPPGYSMGVVWAVLFP
jgi:hypothetical protein